MPFDDPYAAFRVHQPDGQTGALPSEPFQDPYAAFRVKHPSGRETAAPGTIEDIGKAAVTGLGKGAIGLAATPSMAAWLLSQGVDQAVTAPLKIGNLIAGNGYTLPEWSARGAEAAKANRMVSSPEDIGAGDIQRQVERVTGDFYQPQTMAGRAAETIAEFVPGGVIGRAANIPANLAKFGLLPGVVAAGADELARGTAAAPYAKPVAGLMAGGAAGMALRPSRGGAMVSEYAQGMTPASLDAMEALLRDAQAIGLPLTRAEAAQAVTNGATRLADLQHLAEGHGGLKAFMAQRPQQIETAGRQAMDQIAPVPQNPSMIGPAIGEVASGVVQDVQGAINRVTRPLYDRAAQASVGQPVAAALAGDPLYAQTLQAIRRDPSLNRTIANLPDDSPGVIDLVQRRLREQADNAAIPGQASSSNLAAANFQDARTAPIAAAETATGSRPGVMGDYEAARAMQRQLRERFLAPIMSGPIGRLAQKDIPTQKAIEALFPKNPIPNSEPEVQTAIQALATRNPWAARQLVRAHAEQTFNQATKDLQAGANQFGGANFAAQLRGNFQQNANLLAALDALPNGKQIIPGLERMLQVMEATGQRYPIGSKTAFNSERQNMLKSGGLLASGAKVVGSGGLNLGPMVRQKLDGWTAGRNTEEIARLLTDPAAAGAFRALASAPAGSAKAAAALTRLVNLGTKTPSQVRGPLDEQGNLRIQGRNQ